MPANPRRPGRRQRHPLLRTSLAARRTKLVRNGALKRRDNRQHWKWTVPLGSIVTLRSERPRHELSPLATSRPDLPASRSTAGLGELPGCCSLAVDWDWSAGGSASEVISGVRRRGEGSKGTGGRRVSVLVGALDRGPASSLVDFTCDDSGSGDGTNIAALAVPARTVIRVTNTTRFI